METPSTLPPVATSEPSQGEAKLPPELEVRVREGFERGFRTSQDFPALRVLFPKWAEGADKVVALVLAKGLTGWSALNYAACCGKNRAIDHSRKMAVMGRRDQKQRQLEKEQREELARENTFYDEVLPQLAVIVVNQPPGVDALLLYRLGKGESYADIGRTTFLSLEALWKRKERTMTWLEHAHPEIASWLRWRPAPPGGSYICRRPRKAKSSLSGDTSYLPT